MTTTLDRRCGAGVEAPRRCSLDVSGNASRAAGSADDEPPRADPGWLRRRQGWVANARAHLISLTRDPSVGRPVISASSDKDGFHRGLPLDLDDTPRHQVETVCQAGSGHPADLHRARDAIGLHPARHIDRVAPEVVAEPTGPDHAGDDATGVGPNAQLEREAGPP